METQGLPGRDAPSQERYRNGIPVMILFDPRTSGRSVSPYTSKDDEMIEEMNAKLTGCDLDPTCFGQDVLRSNSFHGEGESKPLRRNNSAQIPSTRRANQSSRDQSLYTPDQLMPRQQQIAR
jgi:hypothetical protein